MTGPHRTRERSRWRSRGLIAAVLIVDLLGAGALAVALTRNSSTTAKVANSATAPAAATPRKLARTPQSALPITAQARAPAKQTKPKRHPRTHHLEHTSLPQPAPSPDAQTSFERSAQSLPGAIGVAIAPLGDGPVITFGALQHGHAWSTMKVPVLATVLGELQQRGEVLGTQGRALATAALEQSDNSAAEALFSGLEQTHGGLLGASAAVQGTLRASGDELTSISTAPNGGGFTTWGQSDWSASGEVIFYRSLARGCLLDPSNTRYVLGLMQNVESDQRWGAGSANLPAPLAFKGGWGPENGAGYLVRQSAIVGAGNRGYVLSMLARPSNGQFTTGTQMLTQIAAWAGQTFQLTASYPAPTCG